MLLCFIRSFSEYKYKCKHKTSFSTAISENQVFIQSCLLYCRRLMTTFPDSNLSLPDSPIYSANIFQVIFFLKFYIHHVALLLEIVHHWLFSRNSIPFLTIPYYSATKLPPAKLIFLQCFVSFLLLNLFPTSEMASPP